jgi:pimeloyl-ACP methyl ester carboxylesterase
MPYVEHTFRSRDNLALSYRDYAGDASKAPVLCLHGLTRNCRDFEALAQRIAPTRRVITPDTRGRGKSEYDPTWLNYHPATYVNDVWTLLESLSLDRVIVIGTSLGGLMAILMAALRPRTLAGVVLNDIGPELDPAGVQRIASYAGRLPPVRNWDDVVAQMKLTFGATFPDYTDERWRGLARLSYVEGPDGIPRLAADPKIGDAVRAIPAPPGAVQGMWLAFAALRSTPTLAFRGAHSDLLSPEVFERMLRENPQMTCVTVPNRGHAPQLDEPVAVDALDRFLASIQA